ncbi:MAG: hypothetical protein ACFFCS_01375 [Candidatus Hodarchaeota archaeon]
MSEGTEDIKALMRKLVMLISETRKLDDERYATHVSFMDKITNEVKKIASDMNESWTKLQENLDGVTNQINKTLENIILAYSKQGLMDIVKKIEELKDTVASGLQSIEHVDLNQKIKDLTSKLESIKG